MNSPFDREPNRPGQEPPTNFWRKCLSALGVIGVAILNFGSKLKGFLFVILKFGPAILKSSLSMFLMIGVYGSIWGWRYAIGFVGLLLLHECGHLIAAKAFNLDVGAPVFIPFMGAFIALREAPRNVWVEAWVGIGGLLLRNGVGHDFPRVWGIAGLPVVNCAGVDGVLAEFVQHDSSRDSRWRKDYPGAVALVLGARIRDHGMDGLAEAAQFYPLAGPSGLVASRD